MADVAEDINIDDVLSSVRRLVSESVRPGAETGGEKDALVLTPDHRVPAEGEGPALVRPAHQPLSKGTEDAARQPRPLPPKEPRVRPTAPLEKTPEGGIAHKPAPAAMPPVAQDIPPELEQKVMEAVDAFSKVIDGVDTHMASPSPQAPAPYQSAPYELAGLQQDALRDLVIDLIRAELRGPLGEKITHNVRKLVRREIQRALTINHVR